MPAGGSIATYARGNRTARIDGETALWAGRMLVGEGYQGEKGAAILYTLMNRFMNAPHTWRSYKDLIRNFSVPINDRWLPGGDLFEAAAKRKGPQWKRLTSPQAVKRRKWIRSLSWDDLPNKVRNTVANFAIGLLNGPDIFKRKGVNPDNFASWEGVDAKNPGGFFIGKEYFFKEFPSKGKISILLGSGNSTIIKKFDAPIKKTPGGFALLLIPLFLIATVLGKKT